MHGAITNKVSNMKQRYLYLIVGAILGFVTGLMSPMAHGSDENGETICLAKNIYFEAGNQPLAGKVAVAQVVFNRMEHSAYPKDICGVVYQAKWGKNWAGNMMPIRNQCQFSWFCDGKSDEPPIGDEWRQAQTIAYRMVNSDYLIGIADGATHYHATYVNPKWNKDMLLIGRIGLHIFYVQR